MHIFIYIQLYKHIIAVQNLNKLSDIHFFCSVSLVELYKMVCEPDETDLNIHIPAVMLPQSAGLTLEKMLSNGSSGYFFLPHSNNDEIAM